MAIIATAYTMDDIDFLKDTNVDIVRFGETDCSYIAYKNWPIENVAKAFEILKHHSKIPQFQFLRNPSEKEEINYLVKISRSNPELEIVIDNIGFLTKLANKKVAGYFLKMYNIASLKLLESNNCISLAIPDSFTEEDVRSLIEIIKNENLSLTLEYCFYGREHLLSSWQCFTRRWLSHPQDSDKECTCACSSQELIITDLDNSNIHFSVSGNTIISSEAKNKFGLIKEFCDSGVNNVLLDFKHTDSDTKRMVIEKACQLKRSEESEKEKD